jgi:hypothetical protein
MDVRVVGLGLGAMLAVGVYAAGAVGWRQAALLLIGSAAGVVLYHAAFGFTSGWRTFITERRAAGLRAQMVMLTLACFMFVPLLAWAGPVFGQTLRGSAAPLGASLIVGAFLFGAGMQLGGGCASGTLYTAGGGSIRMLVTLAFFVVGSVVGTAHAPFWERQPAVGTVSLLSAFGPVAALAISLVVTGAIFAGAGALERARHGVVAPIGGRSVQRGAWLTGPWPLVWGAVGLAVVNAATLVVAGRPWGVTSAFALWGAKAASALGVDVASWPYWAVPSRASSLAAPTIFDATSVMNVGIILGAFVAAGLAGRFSPVWRVPLGSLAAAVIGGLCLGYGARLASGCNIGAYFSGVASTSLHGWLWFVAAFGGSLLGARLRPVFGLNR